MENSSLKQRKRKVRRTVSLQVSTATVVLVSILATAMVVHVPWLFTSRKNITSIVTKLNHEIITGVTREVASLFSHALSVQQTIHNIFSQNIIDLDNQKKRVKLYLGTLVTNPNFSWVSFGFPNGDFFGAQRADINSLRTVESQWNSQKKQAIRKIEFYIPTGQQYPVYDTAITKVNNYYAPQRSWYRRAIHTDDPVWTDVYVFNTSKKPGINTAIALKNKKGDLQGVISIAIELEQISFYLQALNVSKNGVVFIMNSKSELMAFQDPSEITQEEGKQGKLKLKSLHQSKHPLLNIAYQVLKANNLEPSQIRSQKQYTYTVPSTKETYFVTFAPVYQLDWTAATVIPESDFLEEIKRNQNTLFYAVLALILLTSGIVLFLSHGLLTTPLLGMTDQANKIKNFNLEKVKTRRTFIREVVELSSAISQMRNGLRTFQKYVPKELVRLLISKGIQARLGGEQRELTIFFSDLVGFTKISEFMGNALVDHLAEYFGEMSQKIIDTDGTIDKYIGDSIMAFWGAPVDHPQHALQACKAALDSRKSLNILCEKWEEEGKPVMDSRIGINTGTVLVGNIGSNQKMDYTVVGDAVNVASRLEALNKVYGTDILIGPNTYHQVKNDVIVRKIDKVALYGKTEFLEVYELLAISEEVDYVDEFYNWIEIFEEGLTFYQQQKWEKALYCFQRTIDLRRGHDPPSKLYIKRCAHRFQNPPQENWDGSYVMSNK